MCVPGPVLGQDPFSLTWRRSISNWLKLERETGQGGGGRHGEWGGGP